MNMSFSAGIPIITVFLQGLFSFFAPCVLPLVPLYASYLAGGTKQIKEDGTIVYPVKKILINTFFFILGISFAFLVLALGFTNLGKFFSGNKALFSKIGGVIMIVFGLYQLGIFHRSQLIERQRQLSFQLKKSTMGPISAVILGFTFSFAWTPCVGPALGSVLLMISTSSSPSMGYLLIGVYTLGFVLPFLFMGLFTSTVLRFFQKYQNMMKYTVKIGALLMILMGIITFGGLNKNLLRNTEPITNTANENKDNSSDSIDFQLKDQYGNTHTLSEYRGKTVVLTFWATWCSYCEKELPELQAIYEEYGSNTKDLIILGTVNPKSKDYPNNQDKEESVIKDYLKNNQLTFPVVMDIDGKLLENFSIASYPSTVIIGKDGTISLYQPGAIDKDTLEKLIKQTIGN